MICHTTDEVTSVQHFQRYVIKQTMTVCLRSDGLPQIENKIVELTEQLTNGVRQNLTEMKEAIQSNSATVQETMVDAVANNLDVIFASLAAST